MYFEDFEELVTDTETESAPFRGQGYSGGKSTGGGAQEGKGGGRNVAADSRRVELTPWKLPTDAYGREITANMLSNADGDIDYDHLDSIQSDVKMVKGLASSLDAPKRARDQKTQDIIEAPQALLSFSDTLHKGLKFLWFPMVLLGRLPFRLLLHHNRAIIYVSKKNPAYIACWITSLITWILFVWITLGIINIIAISGHSKLTDTQEISVLTCQRYWTEMFIFWTTLLQASISTSHILREAEELAIFIKEWYRVLDTSKIEVSRTLKKYIIINEVIIVLFLATMVTMFCLPKIFPHFQGTAWVIVIALIQPFISLRDLPDYRTTDPDGRFYFQKYAGVGLGLYIMAILFSWMYIIQFMVFCRCFRKGLKAINNRLAMILDVDDVQRVGPNAVRLTYEYIHKDYLEIATTGGKIGQIYSWTMCNYYLWAILVLVVELGEIFIFAKKDYRKRTPDELRRGAVFKEHGFDQIIPPTQVVINQILHFAITAVCIFYVSHEGSGAHKEGKISYELARYRGLVDCTTQLERNFIRSIWIIVSEKCPVHVSPGKFFGVTNSTVMTVFATAFTYFIFWVQSQGQLQGVTKKGEQ